MRIRERMTTIGLSLLLMTTLTACGSARIDNGTAGKWAYNHDTETCVLNLQENGETEFEGKQYSADLKDDRLVFTDDSGAAQEHRYELNSDGMLFYETKIYDYAGDGTPDGLVGTWQCEDNKWSFEFNDKGEFREDGYFPGYYTVDETQGSFTMVYNDHFADTTCYYSIDGNKLTVEYPWQMVRMN